MTQLADATRQKEAWARAVYINNDDANDSAETEWWRQAATNAENAALREWDYWRAVERDCAMTTAETVAANQVWLAARVRWVDGGVNPALG